MKTNEINPISSYFDEWDFLFWQQYNSWTMRGVHPFIHQFPERRKPELFNVNLYLVQRLQLNYENIPFPNTFDCFAEVSFSSSIC